MFDIGFWELFIIGIIALVVLGPERLPIAMRTVGTWVGKAKRGYNSIKTEIDRELKIQEIQQQLEEQKRKLSENNPAEGVQQAIDEAAASFQESKNSIDSEATENIANQEDNKITNDKK